MSVNSKENKSLGWLLSLGVAIIGHCYLFAFFEVAHYKEIPAFSEVKAPFSVHLVYTQIMPSLRGGREADEAIQADNDKNWIASVATLPRNDGDSWSEQPKPHFSQLVAQTLLPDSKMYSPKAPVDQAYALYLQYWRTKVERVGRLHYPAVALELESYKDIQLAVLLGANGQLIKVRFLKSSGNERLDQAIIDIIERSAPFAPMVGSAEPVEIITNWDLGQHYAFNARTY